MEVRKNTTMRLLLQTGATQPICSATKRGIIFRAGDPFGCGWFLLLLSIIVHHKINKRTTRGAVVCFVAVLVAGSEGISLCVCVKHYHPPPGS